MKKYFVLCTIVFFAFAACTNNAERQKAEADTYEKSKMSLEEIEKASPVKFLAVSGTDKRNLLGQTVVRGKVHNSAKTVTYKDVDIKLSFYSKTGTLLMEDNEVVYDNFEPGSTKNFKSKYFAPKGTDSIAMKVVKAKF